MCTATVYDNYSLSQLTEGERAQVANGLTIASARHAVVPVVNMAANRHREEMVK